MSVHPDRYCDQCGSELHQSARFCSDCGHAIGEQTAGGAPPQDPAATTTTVEHPPTSGIEDFLARDDDSTERAATTAAAATAGSPQEAASTDPAAPDDRADPDDTVGQPADEAGSHGRRHSRRIQIAVAAVVLVLAGAGAASFFVLTAGPSEDELAADAATQQSQDLLDALAEAETTEGLRAVAAEASSMAQATTGLAQAADAESVAGRQLHAQAGLQTSIAAMSTIDADNLDRWQTTKADLEEAVEAATVAAAAADTEPPVRADGAVAHVDAIITDAQETLKTWRAEVTKIRKQNKAKAAARGQLQDYAAAASGIMDEYTALRSDTGRFVDRIRTDYVTYAEAYTHFSAGEHSRRDLVNRLQGLDYPDGMAAAHGEVVSVIASGADAMNAAYDGLEDSQYCYTSDPGGCNYRQTPGWERFQTVSDQNTGGFDSARAAWQEKIDSLDKKLGGRDLPEQPEV